jgi:hypothetical protein
MAWPNQNNSARTQQHADQAFLNAAVVNLKRLATAFLTLILVSDSIAASLRTNVFSTGQ